MQESQGATVRTSRLNQFCFIDFVLFHLDHFVEIVFENNIFFFNIKIKFNTIITGDYVLLFYAIKNLLTAYHIDKSSTGKIIEPLK
ncbi:hypothetical protein R0052_09230 [Lactobacillus helveticus R0052]|nr:hypothetical protein R0052_09230 [Lactobacillus helveticus R0052]